MQHFYWDETRVNNELKTVMQRSYANLAATAKSHNIDLRTAAFVMAVERVARATALRGI
jgi:glutamate dehydrogenase (NAD(P)+)